jgi:hypothetical protein
MKYFLEMGSGAKFHKDWFRHSKVEEEETDTQTAWGSHKPIFIISK